MIALPQVPAPGPAAGTASSSTDRIEALVQVASGIAPALSDLLTVIRGQADELLDMPGTAAPAVESAHQIYSAAEKAGSLVRQLLIFSQQHAMQLETVDLNRLIDETTSVLLRLLGREVSLQFELNPGATPLLADPTMLEQMLIILALNSREAMPGGGQVTFATEEVELDGTTTPQGTGGKFVVLTVRDTGRGIAPEVLPRIFEPFFTTKPEGRSAGMGLAAVFGIVQSHRGWISVESVVNAGTTVRTFLPAAPSGAVAPIATAAGAAARGGETILLVEDDPAVRGFTASILARSGYRVLQAASGADALETWAWHSARIRVLLTDLVLDDAMTGTELIAKLREQSPRLKTICTSGHTRATMQRFPELSAGCRFLQKPCRPQALVAAVRAALDETPP